MTPELHPLTQFLNSIREDNRISPTHISLYMALFQFYILNCYQNPIEISRLSVMDRAKISGLATYHKCIKDLNDYNYIRYQPSFNPRISSKVWLMTK